MSRILHLVPYTENLDSRLIALLPRNTESPVDLGGKVDMRKGKAGLLFITIIVLLFVSACRNNGGHDEVLSKPSKPTPPPTVTEPVTLKLFFSTANQEVFQTYVESPLKAKYPNITLEYLAQKPGLAELVAAGDIPDLMNSNDMNTVTNLELQYDLKELIKKYNFDLSSVDQNLVQSIESYSPSKELFALPAGKNSVVLMYNKDIFDKFAVPYPKDGMTWEKVIELSRRLTRSDQGVQYHGFHPGVFTNISSELSLRYFGNDGQANVTTPEWQHVAQVWKNIFEVNQNNPAAGNRPEFQEQKITAMIITNPSFLIRNPDPGMNWDMVSPPVFDNKLVIEQLGQMFFISQTGKNKDAAFLALSIFYSDEVQTAMNRDGALLSSSSKAEIQKQYGANIKEAQGKHLQAIFYGKGAVRFAEEHEDVASPIMKKSLNGMITDGKDINTSLREAQEQINQKLKETKSQ
jgi:multiple sugar transport system substrate-binding protein